MLTENEKLLAKLRAAAAPLEGLSEKKMFGCDTVLANGVMFAMVWKEGRIAVKLTDPARYEEVAALRGVEPWRPRGKPSGAWLLLSPAIAKNAPKLSQLVREAHAEGLHRATRKAAANLARNH